MFQAVIAFGIVVTTLVYAVFSMVRFLIPAKNKNTSGCSGGSCNCSGSTTIKHSGNIKTHHLKTAKLR